MLLLSSLKTNVLNGFVHFYDVIFVLDNSTFQLEKINNFSVHKLNKNAENYVNKDDAIVKNKETNWKL